MQRTERKTLELIIYQTITYLHNTYIYVHLTHTNHAITYNMKKIEREIKLSFNCPVVSNYRRFSYAL